MIRIGILQAGLPPAPLSDRFGSYPAMIATLLGDGHDYRTFDAMRGELPQGPDACQAYVVTGSAADAFAQADWIGQLRQFLRSAAGRAALVGICFGHQLMAEAFGGRVARADMGWGIGLHSYIVRARQDWMDETEAFSLPASHRDQVTIRPERATLIASSFFCPVAALEYEDFPALSFQAHPEFDPDFARALIRQKQGIDYPDDDAEIALATLDYPADRPLIGEWIRRFIARAAA